MIDTLIKVFRQVTVTICIEASSPTSGAGLLPVHEVVIVRSESEPSVIRDILFVLKQLSYEDFQAFVRDVLIEDLWRTIVVGKSKAVAALLRSIPKRVLQFLRNPFAFSKEAWSIIRDKVLRAVRQLHLRWTEMSARKRLSFVIATLLHALIFAAGVYAGSAIPDLDIIFWGIGSHRNVFTHSILPGIAFEFVALAVHRLISGFSDRLPVNAHPIWRNLRHVHTGLDAASAGIYAGLSLHLFKDLVIDGSQSIRGPRFNTFVNGTYWDDNSYLFAHMAHSGSEGSRFSRR